VVIDPPVSFEDLAALVGTDLGMVSRAMTVWREQGAVFPTGRRRLWLNPERLRDGIRTTCGRSAAHPPPS
jgi:hypothetical protein